MPCRKQHVSTTISRSSSPHYSKGDFSHGIHKTRVTLSCSQLHVHLCVYVRPPKCCRALYSTISNVIFSPLPALVNDPYCTFRPYLYGRSATCIIAFSRCNLSDSRVTREINDHPGISVPSTATFPCYVPSWPRSTFINSRGYNP